MLFDRMTSLKGPAIVAEAEKVSFIIIRWSVVSPRINFIPPAAGTRFPNLELSWQCMTIQKRAHG